MSTPRAPAQPFQMVAMGAGYTSENLHVLSAWLQSDAVREQRGRPTKLALGADVAVLLGNPQTLKVDADDADSTLFPTGPRESPKDDLNFPVDDKIEGVPPDCVMLLQQSPPGQQPRAEESS